MAALTLRDALTEELAVRAAQDPAYSLRKFAAEIEISPAQLSKVLSGKANLSVETIAKISTILKWPDYLTNHAITQAAPAKALTKISILKKKNQIVSISDIEKESVLVATQSYHTAILDMTQLKNFVPDTKRIADKLQIEVSVAQEAIHRLIDLKYLKINVNGSWEDTTRPVANRKMTE
ncbi:MAG: DUF4423 domain-containing protein [Bdellovibrio sp.]|nr:DUF4423 domain-containing protein [Bdellovibrio sp.]